MYFFDILKSNFHLEYFYDAYRFSRGGGLGVLSEPPQKRRKKYSKFWYHMLALSSFELVYDSNLPKASLRKMTIIDEH